MSYRRAIGACSVAAVALLLPAVAAPSASAAPDSPYVSSAVGAPTVGGPKKDAEKGKDRLDRSATKAPRSVGAWFVDDATGNVMVETVNMADAQKFVADSAATTADAVQIKQVSATPKPFFNLVGGQAIYNGTGRCSIGFSARSASATYVITAGHCTELGGSWSGFNMAGIGPASTSNFPTDDFGSIMVSNTTTWTPTAQVEGGTAVTGSTEAAVGAAVCRSGSTTGYRCGTIQAKSATVNYGGGDVVYGLTRTTVCAEPGDSGGSFVAGSQAQGVTSGGSGDCRFGGTTYFQPVNEALSRLGLTLVTG